MLSGGVLLNDQGSLLRALESCTVALPNRERTLHKIVECANAINRIAPPLEVAENYELDTHVVVLFRSRPF